VSGGRDGWRGRDAAPAGRRGAARGGAPRVAGALGRGVTPATRARGGAAVPRLRPTRAGLRAGAVRRLSCLEAGGLQLQGARVVPLVRSEADAGALDTPQGSAAPSGLPAVDADVASPGAVGGAQAAGAGTGSRATPGARGVALATGAGEAAGRHGPAAGRSGGLPAALRKRAAADAASPRLAARGAVGRRRGMGGAATARGR
jgi:hypothetical protein